MDKDGPVLSVEAEAGEQNAREEEGKEGILIDHSEDIVFSVFVDSGDEETDSMDIWWIIVRNVNT